MEEVEVVIVGGGAAGLRCATQLQQSSSPSVVVLEARDRVGGRTCTKEYNGYTWDVGGQWIGPGQDRAYALARYYNIPIFPQYHQGKNVLEYFGKLKKYTGTIPPLSIVALIELQLHMFYLERIARKLPLQRTFDENTAKWDTMSVQGMLEAGIAKKLIIEGYMDKYMWTDVAKNLFRVGIISVWSCEPREISMLYLLHYVRGSGSLNKLFDVVNGAQQDRIEGGLHQLSLRMAEDLGNRVRLNHPVTKISQEGEFIIVHSQGRTFKAKQVVVTLPPPPLPMARQHLAQRMPMGQVIKYLIFYREPFWKNAGFSGEAVSTRESTNLFFDACYKDNYALVGFFEGSAARTWSNRTEKERKAEVAEFVFRAFNNKAALEPIAYVEQDWQREQWSLGGYTGVCSPGVLTSDVWPTIDESCWDNTLHWGGTETSYVWPGYVEGALNSGDVCAQKVFDQKVAGTKRPEKVVGRTGSRISILPVLIVSVISALLYWYLT